MCISTGIAHVCKGAGGTATVKFMSGGQLCTLANPSTGIACSQKRRKNPCGRVTGGGLWNVLVNKRTRDRDVYPCI